MKKSASQKSLTVKQSAETRASVTPRRLFRSKQELEQSVNRLHKGESIRKKTDCGPFNKTVKHDRTKANSSFMGTDFASRVKQLNKANEENQATNADNSLIFHREDIIDNKSVIVHDEDGLDGFSQYNETQDQTLK